MSPERSNSQAGPVRMENDKNADACREDEFVRLLSEHRHVLFNYIFCVVQTLPDAEDVFQQTTLSMWNNFQRFQPESDFQAWAIRFARFRALNFIRSKRRHAHVFFRQDGPRVQWSQTSIATTEALLISAVFRASFAAIRDLPA